MTVLLAGVMTERPLAMVAAALDGMRTSVWTIDQQDLVSTDLVLEHRDGKIDARVVVGGAVLRLEDITGVYVRVMETAALPILRAGGRHHTDLTLLRRAERIQAALVDWLNIAPGTVVNRPEAMATNLSKPLQAQLISALGFRVPPTLVTDDPDEVLAFADQHGPLIYKSTSAVRSIVRRLEPSDRNRLDLIRGLPTQFQAVIEGTDVRVHVVGSQVFPTAVTTDAVDYRYAGRDGVPVNLAPTCLPLEIAGRCVALCDQLGLQFCGIDFRRRPDGEYVCFEVNPMPAFSYYEDHTGQSIATAVARHISKSR